MPAAGQILTGCFFTQTVANNLQTDIDYDVIKRGDKTKIV